MKLNNNTLISTLIFTLSLLSLLKKLFHGRPKMPATNLPHKKTLDLKVSRKRPCQHEEFRVSKKFWRIYMSIMFVKKKKIKKFLVFLTKLLSDN